MNLSPKIPSPHELQSFLQFELRGFFDFGVPGGLQRRRPLDPPLGGETLVI